MASGFGAFPLIEATGTMNIREVNLDGGLALQTL